MLTALILAVVAYALDQLTKYAVESTMQLGDSVAVIPGVLRWHYILN
ncbi:signal peptidase II, partial [Thiopseudomonas sp. 4R-3cl]